MKNKERAKQLLKKWEVRNRAKRYIYFRKYQKEYQKERRRNDPKFRLDANMKTAIWFALKDKKNRKSWKELVGYSINALIEHLERQFTPEMSWANYGSYWSIDHIKPISLFSYTSPEDMEFRECWSLKNLQPLEAIKNIKKSNKYEEN